MDLAQQQTDALARAILIAAQAHLGQRDKGGAPYVLHPLRLVLRLNDPKAQIVAALHDVVEDTDITLDDLRCKGFREPVLAAVEALTRREGEPYDDYIERMVPNPLAVRVKLEDLRDNLDLTRPKLPDPDAEDRVAQYTKALLRLESLVDGR